MKKIFNNNRFIAIAFFTVFSIAASPAVNAGDKHPSIPVEMKFAGFINNQPLFLLNFSGNAQQDEFTITINDEFGNSLYKENIKGEKFIMKFLLNTDEIEDDTLLFNVYSKKTKQSVSYEVNRNSHFVEEVVINKVK